MKGDRLYRLRGRLTWLCEPLGRPLWWVTSLVFSALLYGALGRFAATDLSGTIALGSMATVTMYLTGPIADGSTGGLMWLGWATAVAAVHVWPGVG